VSDISGLREQVRGRRAPWRQRLPINRRALLTGGAAAGGLVVAWTLWPRSHAAGINAAPDEAVLGNYLKVGRDGHVTVLVPQTETGQGIFTEIAQIVADELGADWRTVAVEPAPLSAVYANSLFIAEDAAMVTPRNGVPNALVQFDPGNAITLPGATPALLTGASTSVRMHGPVARDSAALARALLCMAAAARWDVAWEACETREGFVIHGDQRLRFGALVDAAAQLSPPAYPAYRPVDEHRLIGRTLPRLDLPAKIDGSASFAADIRLPNMAYAAIRQGPHGDTRLLRYDRAGADRVRGFIAAVRNGRWLAAVATNGWAAQRALDAMAPVFRTTGPLASSAAFERRFATASGGVRIVDEGSTGDAFAGRSVIGADYHIAPALHAPLETRSATAAPDSGRMRVWVATQAPAHCRAAIAAALAIADSDVALFIMPAGGGTGVAFDHDVAVQAALIARAINRPVQLSWSRAEEIIRDSPRAPARIRMRGTLSAGTSIDGWQAQIISPPARHQFWARLAGASGDTARRSAGVTPDAAMVAGARTAYTIPNVGIDHLSVDSGLPAGHFAGQADSATIFAAECFVDELAKAANVDPLSFRIGMLGQSPRLVLCLQNATAQGGWDGGGAGSGQGIACASLRGSSIAVMATVRAGERGLIIDRLIAVADAGHVVNAGIARQQIECALVLGLSTAIGSTTRYVRGLAQARQLRDLNLPILGQMPAITVDLIPSRRPRGGIEEIALPLVAPAIANALFTLTGRRLRRLPLSDKPVPR
jgi:isoquinoline 1-oxidoreductase subunit beta